MKAFLADAEWAPRPDYALTPDEESRKRAISGCQVWRNPVFSLSDAPIPEIGEDEVLVRVQRCGICGSDTHLYETDADGYVIFSGPAKLPCIIGHECTGIVEMVGRRVRGLAPGDPVAAESIVWCGSCTPCRSGTPNQCSHAELAGITVDGSLAEYAAISARQLWKLDGLTACYDDDLLFDVGTLIEPLGCAYNGMFVSAGGFLPGAMVVVHGAGPIGLGAVALAAAAGAAKVMVFDPVEERLELARRMGADSAWNVGELQSAGIRPRDIVLEQTKGLGADVQVEAAGAARQTIPEMEASLAVNGSMVYLGRAGRTVPLALDLLVTGASRIVGSRGHAGQGIYPNIIRLLAAGRLEIEEMITARLPFSETMTGLSRSSERKDGKIVINLNKRAS